MKFTKTIIISLLLIYVIPVVWDDQNRSQEIIWLLYIFPAVLLPFLLGKKGGIIAAVAGTVIHGGHEFIEVFVYHEKYNSTNIWYMFLTIIINLLVALTIGLLVERLKKEQLTLKEAMDKMEFMAFHDNLTGLPNRWYFETKLKGALEEAKKNNNIIAVLFIDLDRFKLINDSLGHLGGDQLLKEISGRLSGTLKEGEFLARQGGDEFILFLTQIHSKEEAKFRTAAIHELIQVPLYIVNNEYIISSSIGISIFPTDGTSWEELIKQADIAMYSAKETGRNGFQFYDTAKLKQINDVVKIEALLRKALQFKEFELYYQPIINLKTKKMIGMEALIRWNNSEIGIISPLDFIPLAEEIGAIGQLGEWVLREACLQAKKISSQYHIPIRVAVNISTKQFKDIHFVDIVRSVLNETGLMPQQLELEITESISLDNVEEVIIKLNRLKMMGITIAIDDFGTGYSSISYLKHLPIDTLKIDQTFVRNMLNNKKDKALVESIISLANNFGLKVTAEGVETNAQLEALEAYNCSLAQGYFISMPVPYEEFCRFIEQGFHQDIDKIANLEIS